MKSNQETEGENFLQNLAEKVIESLPGSKAKLLPISQTWIGDVLRLPRSKTLFDLKKAARKNALNEGTIFHNPEGLSPQEIESLLGSSCPQTLLVVETR